MIIEELKKLQGGGVAEQLRQIGMERKGLEAERRLGTSVRNVGNEVEERITTRVNEMIEEAKNWNNAEKINTLENRILDGVDEMLNTSKSSILDNVDEMLDASRSSIAFDVRQSVRDGKDGKSGKDGKTFSEDKIKALIKEVIPKSKEKKVSVEEIEGLQTRLISISSRVDRARGGGGDTIIADDLSSQADGATRIFTTTKKVGKSLLVVSSQFPTVLRLTTDFTAAGTTLTLDSALDYVASGQTLYFLYSEG